MKIKPTSRPGQVRFELNRRDDQLLQAGAAKASAAAPSFQLKNILVPIDYSDYSLKALRYALPFAEKYDARLILLHVVEPRVYPENYFDILVPAEMEQVNMELVATARKQLAALCRTEINPKIAADPIVRIGRPYAEIIHTAKEWDIDLIIIATHGYTGLKHAFLGSTAERVVRQAPCPVLTVREQEHDFV
ncbi:MAG: universal stress protein [Verrucomicrobia bacterium]|nr:universal stress protein [Verrucomicrobiota bacterium]